MIQDDSHTADTVAATAFRRRVRRALVLWAAVTLVFLASSWEVNALIPPMERPPWTRIGANVVLILVYATAALLLGRLVLREVDIAARRLQEEIATELVRRKLDRLKSDLLATVSHELRTPLSLVIGYAELLKTREVDREQMRLFAGEILAGAETLSHLVDDLLEFAQLERGELDVQPQLVDLIPVLREAAAVFRRGPGGERLVLDLPATLRARADPERTSQVIRSLLVNARRYAPTGAIILRAASNREVWIEVADHGPGIPPEEQRQVWERFYRGSQVAGQSGVRGLGLGLPLVKLLVEAQGGRVALTSAPGQGSTFRVVLPAAPPGLENHPGSTPGTLHGILS
ncbi:MAG: HAMP domain-containing histidine kinase [Chloroflexi bacterium]|nr:HAMP domain-containing histidine kinase [Chloroflexota bacterium]